MSSEHVLFRVSGPIGEDTGNAVRTALRSMNGVLEVMLDAEQGSIAVEYDAERIHSGILKEVLEDSGCRPK